MYIYNISSCLQQFKNYKNPSRFSRVMITNVLPPFYCSQCITALRRAIGTVQSVNSSLLFYPFHESFLPHSAGSRWISSRISTYFRLEVEMLPIVSMRTEKNVQSHENIRSRDLQSFAIRFEFESDISVSIRFESEHLTKYRKPRSLFKKKLQPLRSCN